MGAGGGNSLRGAGSARITFFVFLDIITAVTGILVLVILLLALRSGDGVPAVAGLDATASTGQAPADAALEADLAQRLTQLDAIAAANHQHDLELTAAETATDVDTLRAELVTLRAALAKTKSAAARNAADAQVRAEAAAARDDAAGITANRAQIEQARGRVAQLTADNAAKRQQSETLEADVKAAEARLLAAQNRGKNRVWLVPELPATSKAPLLITVAGSGATAERFNRPDTRVTLKAADGANGLRRLLEGYKHLDDYLVFYVRPSGIDLFEKYREVARAAGFEIGYDALEENRELIFSARTD